MKTGIYGGTFDPVHHGHLILARDAVEHLGLDRVIFVPAAISPHKGHTAPVAPEVRLRMLQAAIRGEDRFEVDDLELRRDPPSYTVDTVVELRQKYPGDELCYFIGEDNVPLLHTWRRIEELRELVQFVVFRRHASRQEHALPTLDRRIDISSTEIRRRIAAGASISYLVPPAVEQMIQAERLYQEPAR